MPPIKLAASNLLRKLATLADAFDLLVDQAILRGISVQEVREAIAGGVVIEDYPGDKYGPSCLLLGFTDAQRPLHIQCSYPSRPLVNLITVYEPDPDLWTDFRTRT